MPGGASMPLPGTVMRSRIARISSRVAMSYNTANTFMCWLNTLRSPSSANRPRDASQQCARIAARARSARAVSCAACVASP